LPISLKTSSPYVPVEVRAPFQTTLRLSARSNAYTDHERLRKFALESVPERRSFSWQLQGCPPTVRSERFVDKTYAIPHGIYVIVPRMRDATAIATAWGADSPASDMSTTNTPSNTPIPSIDIGRRAIRRARGSVAAKYSAPTLIPIPRATSQVFTIGSICSPNVNPKNMARLRRSAADDRKGSWNSRSF